MLRTTHRATELPALPACSDPLSQLQDESQPVDGPGAIRCVGHPQELSLGGMPVTCSACRARRDWLLINHSRNVWIRCRCGNQRLEPEISRAHFDTLIASPYGTRSHSVTDALAALGFDSVYLG